MYDMNFHADVNIPTGKAGEKLSGEISGVLSQAGIGSVSPNLSVVPVGVAITGSMKSPKFAITKAKYGNADGASTSTSIKEQVSGAVTEKVDEYKHQADSILQQKKDEAQKKVEEKANEAADKLKEQLKNKLPFKR
jgi:hypothetical protein